MQFMYSLGEIQCRAFGKCRNNSTLPLPNFTESTICIGNAIALCIETGVATDESLMGRMCADAVELTRRRNMSTGVKNVVFVHGAWADGSCWSKVIPLLEAEGLHTVAVQNPTTSLADDVAATKAILALQDGPALLVGHSYGGAIITEAGNDPKVVGLVFVAAFAPAEGESIASISKPYPTAPLFSELRPDGQGFLTVTPKGIAEDFAQDLSEQEKQLITAVQGRMSAAAFGDKITTAAWKTKPSWFAIAANDRAIPPELQKAEAARMNATMITLPSSHLAMLSHPKEVAELIGQAAAKAGSRGDKEVAA
jgi:pimeloyl-ACP methyl ester carboxylesterase